MASPNTDVIPSQSPNVGGRFHPALARQIAHATPSAVRWNFQDMTTRILIIDNDPSLRECLELAFAAERQQLVVASNAEEAFQRIGEFPIDVVFADTTLPGLDGLDLLPQLAQRLPLHWSIMQPPQGSWRAP